MSSNEAPSATGRSLRASPPTSRTAPSRPHLTRRRTLAYSGGAGWAPAVASSCPMCGAPPGPDELSWVGAASAAPARTKRKSIDESFLGGGHFGLKKF
ncbi:hypothetical protein MRB53_005489 [Persea americana]|uniref:Uncharacterized protein n=1 Tax=Persea americana TaxID=3435 RepID=A0ACC2MDL8_PERAE|nr:hypothetical protein MRB53_005489 [Persea americana]